MITKITVHNVASYKCPAVLDTDKKVNLIYGLNGTGKSTLSGYLNKPKDDRYKSCSIVGYDDSHELLVYNQGFILDNFYESENLKGIFTLSKENKEVETRILNATNEIKSLVEEKEEKIKFLDEEKTSIGKKLDSAKLIVWKIKTEYSGGDRVMEFCLDGLKGSKDSLYNYIVGIQKPNSKPARTVEELKSEVQSLSGVNAQKCPRLSPIEFLGQGIESEILFDKQIVGNDNSTVSKLIKDLGNSDWVKQGLGYLPNQRDDENSTCPFCQENTISPRLIENLQKYFDASYVADVNALKMFHEKYRNAKADIPDKSTFEANPKYDKCKNEFEKHYNAFVKIVDDNIKLIEDKIKSPSVSVRLLRTDSSINQLNAVIKEINAHVDLHNSNIDQKETVKGRIKNEFWKIMRWEYDQTLSSIITDSTASKGVVDGIELTLKEIDRKISQKNEYIAEQQRKTVNIEEAIANINRGLVDLGITDFEISKHSDNLYNIVRGGEQDRVFRSLSEGERMVISFLYFVELCRGKKAVTEGVKKKVVVIDDPISSLSHVYVFNVGRLIHNEFLRTDHYEQVFILTHSLYFFYEMTDTNKERRELQQKLFRLRKNANGSEILPMKYEEIQNDYQSYWFIVKDDKQPPALIANCMRNIIEYFYNFVEKNDLNNFFQKKEMQNNRFQAFNRYVNRESHSLGQNIFDIKEFNYQDYRDAFAELFRVTGYEDHYKKMIK